MPNTVQLTKNGQEIYPVTHESLVVGLNKRAYDSQDPNGIGYLVLEKDKTFAEQVTDENTIYEIRYVFDLSGENLTIPSGCVLKFDGGKISNGTLTGQDTGISAEAVEIFSGITISGTWTIPLIYSKWFLSDNKTVENTLALNNQDIYTEVFIDGDYDMLVENVGMSGPNVVGNTVVNISGTLSKASGSTQVSSMIDVVGDNVVIRGGVIDGKKSRFDTSSEYGQGIIMTAANHNVLIDSVNIKDCRGDGLYLGGTTAPLVGITVENCEISGCRRNGISLIWGENILIQGTYIHDIAGTSPEAAIDIEPNYATQFNKNIKISNCRIESSIYGLSFAGGNAKITDVIVENTRVALNNYRYGLIYSGLENALFSNCDFVLSGTKQTTYSISSGSDGSLNKNINFVGCGFISTASTGTFLTGNANYVACYFSLSGEPLCQILGSKYLNCKIECKGLCQNGNADGAVIDSCNVVSSDGCVLSGTSSNKAQGIIIRNSRLTINATYYPFNMDHVKDYLFENNIMSLTGDRNLINVTNGENVRINSNRIILGSNQNGIVIASTCSECQVKDNIFEIADGVSYTKTKVSGINATDKTTNKVGDPFFAGGKMVVYDGVSVVNVDGTPL